MVRWSGNQGPKGRKDPLVGPIRTVGRHRELETLRDLLRRTQASEGSVVVLVGPAGIGKTHILRWLEEEGRRLGFRTLSGNALEGVSAPLFLWEQVFRSPGGGEGPTPALPGGTDLARARPPRSLPPPTSRTRGTDEDQSERDGSEAGESPELRLLGYLSRLEKLSAQTPCLLLVDDLQWADPLSLTGLRFLGRNLRRLPVLLACAWRDEEDRRSSTATEGRATSPSEVMEVMDVLDREASLRRLPLRPLNPLEARRLLEGRLGATLAHPEGDPRWEEVLRLGAGRPYFLLEVTRHLEDQGLVQRRGGRASVRLPPGAEDSRVTPSPLPPSLQRLLARRLEGLDPVDLRVLQAGSVVGMEFPVAAAASASELTLADSEQRLDRIERKGGILQRVPGTKDSYAIAHALMREVVLEGMATGLSRLMALHLARWWVRERGQELDTIAYLYHRSGQRGEAWPWVHRAMFQAAERRAASLADRYAGWMREFAEEGGGDSLVEAEEEVKLARTLLYHGETDLALRLLLRVLDLPLPQEQRWRAEVVHGELLLSRDVRQAQRIATRLERETTRAGAAPPERLRVETAYLNLSVQVFLEDYRKGLQVFREARARVERSGDPALLARFLARGSECQLRTGNVRETERDGRRALEAARKSGDDYALILPLLNAARLAWIRNDFPASLRYHQEAARVQRRIGSVGGLCMTLATIALYRLKLVQLEEVGRTLDEADYMIGRALENLRGGFAPGFLFALRGEFLRVGGRWRDSDRHFQRAQELLEEAGFQGTVNYREILVARALLRGEMGDPEGGLRAIDDPLLRPRPQEWESHAVTFHAARGRLAELREDLPTAREEYRHAYQLVKGAGTTSDGPDPQFEVSILMALAHLEKAHGDGGAARRWEGMALRRVAAFGMNPPDPERFPVLWPLPSSIPSGGAPTTSPAAFVPRAADGPREGAPVYGPSRRAAEARGESLSERILVHLLGQPEPGPDRPGTLGQTQEGIARALGRPQNVFAKTLQGLVRRGLVSEESRVVVGSLRRRRIYRLTSLGRAMAQDLRRTVPRTG